MRTGILLHGREQVLRAPRNGAGPTGEGTALVSSPRRMRARDARRRVLVVDDEEVLRELTAAWLSDEGFVVATARNGADALGHLPEFCPDAIVLDLMMPVMDGWSFAEACHRLTGPVGIPIVVVSAGRRLVEAAERLRPFGVRAALAKPFDLEILAATVSTLVQRDESLVTAAAS